jgi:hypothetical protein
MSHILQLQKQVYDKYAIREGAARLVPVTFERRFVGVPPSHLHLRKELVMKAIAFLLVLVGCVGWTVLAGEKPADPHDDSRNLLGTWKYVSFIEGGEKAHGQK